ncbi:MAG: chromosomal replication initiator protein DnaA [bacterium]
MIDRTAQFLWEKALSLVDREINRQSFDTWFSQTKAESLTDEKLTVAVPDILYADWLSEHYYLLVKNIIFSICQKPLEIEFKSNKSLFITSDVPEKPLNRNHCQESKNNLNLNYTFSNYVVGPSNQLANASCMAVADQPAKTYNPLFIYGATGLGKTHLLQAICHRIRELNEHPGKTIYISAESFTNELISAIRFDHIQAFREKFRNMDFLLIDDIQFIAGKDRTEEEFFHTFNTLYQANKQIVIASDRPPTEIPTLEERLCSRFQWGLSADIQPPDLETKVAIIKKKAASLNFLDIPDNVCFLIASNVKSNVRQLEGALVRITAHSSLNSEPITIELAKGILKDFILEKEKLISLDNILKTTADYFNLKVSDLKSKSRTSNITLPRQTAMYICCNLTNHSLSKIGKVFGGKDHTTVLYARDKVEKIMEQDKEFNKNMNRLISLISGDS